LDIVSHALEPFETTDGRAARITIVGDNIHFPPKSALALGIVFNELATNAVKYGALANEAGSLRIHWRTERSPGRIRVNLQWQETGGPPVKPPSRKGFGSRAIERVVVHELEGTVDLDYRAEGLICKMIISVPTDS
jgi:two-component sensor histidine kinase